MAYSLHPVATAPQSSRHPIPAGLAEPPARIAAFDWLRVVAVLAIFLSHAAYIFSVTADASIRNADTSLALSVYGGFIYQWAVPLLFLLAGASSWCSREWRSPSVYVRERVRRLLIPLLFGSVALIPWLGYMSALNQGRFTGSYWAFLPVHFVSTWATLQQPQHHHGLVALYHSSWHLWFLGDLFLFSLLTLPSYRAPWRVPVLTTLCHRRGGLLLLVLPMAVARMALGAAFPAYTDWADTVVFFLCFVYGRVFMRDARLLRAVERDALLWLVLGCAAYALILASFAFGYFQHWSASPTFTPDYLLYQGLLAFTTWCWILAFVAGGLRWLGIDNAARDYATRAVLPFYLFHQVAIATVGVIVVQWPTTVAVKFAVITVVAFAATMLTYECLVRRNLLLQLLFGVKVGTRAPASRACAAITAMPAGNVKVRQLSRIAPQLAQPGPED